MAKIENLNDKTRKKLIEKWFNIKKVILGLITFKEVKN